MIQITVQGELTDLNTYIGALNRNRMMGNRIKQEETDRVAWEARLARVPAVMRDQYPVRITYRWYSSDQRKDIDNVAFSKKFINDGLIIAGVLENDSRKHIDGFTDEFFIDKEKPRVEIVIHTEKCTHDNVCSI